MSHSKKTKLAVRFDYFETPIKIDNTDYIVRFDVEIFPSNNNYKVHKIINKMNLTPVLSANKAGSVPTATEKVSDSYETSLPQSNNSVNTYATQGAENYSPNSKISDTEMFDIIGGNAGTLNNSPATKSNKSAVKTPYNDTKPTQENYRRLTILMK